MRNAMKYILKICTKGVKQLKCFINASKMFLLYFSVARENVLISKFSSFYFLFKMLLNQIIQNFIFKNNHQGRLGILKPHHTEPEGDIWLMFIINYNSFRFLLLVTAFFLGKSTLFLCKHVHVENVLHNFENLCQ